jgi:hypothetical protein
MHEPKGLGQDALAFDYDADNDKLLPVVTGPRQFFVTVRMTAETQTPGAEPVGYTAEKLRTRLLWPRISRILSAADVAIQVIRETINAPVVLDGRQTAVALVDIVFNAAQNETDSDDEGGYFTKVALGGAVDTDLEDVAEKVVGVGIPPPGEDP